MRLRLGVGLFAERVGVALLVTLPLLVGGLVAATVATPGPDADGEVARRGPVPLGLLLGLAVAIALAAGLLALVRARPGCPYRVRRRRLGTAGVAVGVVLLTGLFWWWQPDPTPARAVNEHLTSGVGAGAVALLGCLLAAALVRPGPDGTTADPDDLTLLTHWTATRWGRALAGLLALALTVGVGWLTARADQAYLNAANEYRVTPGVATGPVTAPVSTLTGGARWQTDGRLLELPTGPALTRYGLLLAVGDDVVSVDPATGIVQWRYFRADITEPPRPSAIDGGERVLVDWTSDHEGYLVLDAHDGHRVARWPDAVDDDDLVDRPTSTSAVLLARQVPVGSDSVAGVDDDGSTRWRFAPGRCRNLLGIAARSAAVVEVQDSCGDPSQLVGLDLDTGRQRWALDGRIDVLAATGDTLVTGRGPDYPDLTAIDAATGRTLWTRTLTSSAGRLDCGDNRRVAAVASVVQITCGSAAGEGSRLLQLDPATGAVRADIGLGADVLDAGLTADGRGIVLTGDGGAAHPPTLDVVRSGTATTVPLGTPVSGSVARLFVTGDLVLISTGDRLLALR